MDENPFESPDTIDQPPVEPDVVEEPGDPSAFRVPGPVALAWLLSLMLAVGLFLMVEGLFGPITGVLAIAAGFLLFCKQLWAYRVSANYFAVLFLIMIAGTALSMLEQEWWRAGRGTLILLVTGFILLLLMHPKVRRFYYHGSE
ncbi:hypothetical protein C5Y96_12005 [Blastopirellula marina]|uniref:Uncharacterized protein n=1 Tax=Blastopirellula marina TaxID=124 RepID=A0A2S8FFZ6_9BACT|nr:MULTISPECIES: hypothetical protein [Pirellulaceae]PQO31076.1 hypothetical protein C5Y96_12005 [Blastopirellula marina]RCS51470.1 hypothetical protein DTL36_12015 [Bremerella cremea]